MFFKIFLMLVFMTSFLLSSQSLKAKENKEIEYIKLRENIDTKSPKNLKEIDFIDGLQKEDGKKHTSGLLHTSIDKSQVFVSPSIGITYINSRESFMLPTMDIKMGYQDFLGAYNNNFGLRIYSDILIASNILNSISRSPLDEEFIDSSLSIFSVNTDFSYEISINSMMRFGLGSGFGFGFISYSDEYWDILRGFSSNAIAYIYFLFNSAHKLDVGLRVFFYGLGKYVTRKIDAQSLIESNFINPTSVMIGYSYVF